MAVRRGQILRDFKPISVIIVTLLTQCYEGLADEQRTYIHPIKLLLDLARYLPHVVERRNGEYVIANPTVEGENFAERWNDEDSKHAETFIQWCKLLVADLAYILDATDPAEVRKRVQHAFGCQAAGGAAASSSTLLAGLAPKVPGKVQPVHPGRGLA
jgi:hypothetical protein